MTMRQVKFRVEDDMAHTIDNLAKSYDMTKAEVLRYLVIFGLESMKDGRSLNDNVQVDFSDVISQALVYKVDKHFNDIDQQLNAVVDTIHKEDYTLNSDEVIKLTRMLKNTSRELDSYIHDLSGSYTVKWMAPRLADMSNLLRNQATKLESA